MGVVPLGRGQVGRVGVEVLAASAAVMLGVGEVDVPRTPGDQIADVVQHAEARPIAVAGFATLRAGRCLKLRLLQAIFASGRSSGRVTPSVGSGRYSPGPDMARSSLDRCFLPRSYRKQAQMSWPTPGNDAKASGE